MPLDAALLLIGGGTDPVDLTHVAVGNPSGANNTVWIFSGLSMGAADADRYIIVAVHSRMNTYIPTISDVTVGGNAATLVASQKAASTAGSFLALYIVALPAGTTADVVVTNGASVLTTSVDIFRMVGASSATASDTAGAELASSSAAVSVTLDIPAGGGAVALAAAYDGAGTFTWTGLTEASDRVIDGDATSSAAVDVFSAAQTGRTISADPSATPTFHGVLAASWA